MYVSVYALDILSVFVGSLLFSAISYNNISIR